MLQVSIFPAIANYSQSNPRSIYHPALPLGEAGNIPKARRFFIDEKSANQSEILPADSVGFLSWRGFPSSDRTDC